MVRAHDDMLAGVLETEERPSRAFDDSMALVRAPEAMAPVPVNLREFAPFIPAGTQEPLADYFRFALLGVSVGFAERHLSPYLQEHLEIIPPLLEDIRAVFERLEAAHAPYDPDEFRFRAYDYGVDKACYLDWRLYLSRDMY